MKGLFKQIYNEIKHIRWTALITALALTLFTASLLSVVYVYKDLQKNILNYFDTLDASLTIYAKNVSISTLGEKDGIFQGDISGVTENATVTAPNGNVFKTEEERIIFGKPSIYVHEAGVIYVTDKYLQGFGEDYKGYLIPHTKPWEISMSSEVAEKLGVQVGDVVTIRDLQFTVCGIYVIDKNNSASFPYAYIVSVDENILFYTMVVDLGNAASAYSMYNRARSKGVDISIGGMFKVYLDNLSLVNAFLIAIAAIIFVVNLFILYAMFSSLLHSRMAYVCRLKTLGCTNGVIFTIYFAIIFALVVVISVCAFFLSQAIVANIMDICAQAFDSTFVTDVSFGLACVYFALVTAILVALCFASVRKINNQTVIDTVRSD